MKRIGLLLMTILTMFIPINSQNGNLPDTLKIGKHTVEEWNQIIDTTWGEGLPTEDKLILFDHYWETVDTYYPGFVNNPVNWDSVKNRYRPEIEAGVSKGRFSGIMTKMGFLLQEMHGGAFDYEVFATEPAPGIPIVVTTFYKTNDTVPLNHGRFGAVLTPIDDDNLLVLRTVENHPMGLEAGDIVFGYDGMAWKDIYPLLMEMDFPATSNAPEEGFINGSTDRSAHHRWLSSAGLNWHLFDTLDFQKYGSTDTMHVPTGLLMGSSYSIFANEQLPVEGIEFPGSVLYPEFAHMYQLKPIIYDVINEGTIAYIYFTFGLAPSGNLDIIKDLLNEAISDIKNDSVIEGLILDLRFNSGGGIPLAPIFDQIFDQDFGNYDYSIRKPGGEYWELEGIEYYLWPTFNSEHLERPVALLSGPAAFSGGDFYTYLIHKQLNSRSFGKPSNGAFTYHNFGISTLENYDELGLFWDFGYDGWDIATAPVNFTIYTNGNPEYMLNTSIEVDEKMWFTQDAAYYQKDNMVERAIEWISNVAYAKNDKMSNTYVEVGTPLVITVDIDNSAGHDIELTGEINDSEGSPVGTIEFTDAGTSGDMEAGDGKWTGNYTPEVELFLTYKVSVFDIIEDSRLSLMDYFTSVPLPAVSFSDSSLNIPSENKEYKIYLENKSAADIPNVLIKISSMDSTVLFSSTRYFTGKAYSVFPAHKKDSIKVNLKAAEGVQAGEKLPLLVEMTSKAKAYWANDTIILSAVDVSGVGVEDEQTQSSKVVEIFPNLSYDLLSIESNTPGLYFIEITSLNGQLVFNEKMEGLSHQIDLSPFRKGVYFITIRSKDFVTTRKIVKL